MQKLEITETESSKIICYCFSIEKRMILFGIIFEFEYTNNDGRHPAHRLRALVTFAYSEALINHNFL